MKKYQIPEELQKVYNDFVALQQLRDDYIENNKSYEKAEKAATNANYKRMEFWKKVRTLYPELNEKPLRYKPEKGIIIIMNIKNNKKK